MNTLDFHLMGPLRLSVDIERWPLISPVRITGYTIDAINVVVVTLERNGCVGQAEAAGVYYRNDTASVMSRQIEALRTEIEAGIGRASLQRMLPPGGARNAVDCALVGWRRRFCWGSCVTWWISMGLSF